ncbi:MAG: PadR family transcriptional regulator [Aeoliella sp.]
MTSRNTKRTNKDFLNGIPELLVLRLLDRKAMHGYELVQEIRVASHAKLEFGEGCIYPLLHKLMRNGLLSSRRDHVAGRTRVVYRVTAAGRKKLSTSISHWQTIADVVQLVVHGGEDVARSVA